VNVTAFFEDALCREKKICLFCERKRESASTRTGILRRKREFLWTALSTALALSIPFSEKK
jgi:hypothetical protein